jgi:hypothetical protein
VRSWHGNPSCHRLFLISLGSASSTEYGLAILARTSPS